MPWVVCAVGWEGKEPVQATAAYVARISLAARKLSRGWQGLPSLQPCQCKHKRPLLPTPIETALPCACCARSCCAGRARSQMTTGRLRRQSCGPLPHHRCRCSLGQPALKRQSKTSSSRRLRGLQQPRPQQPRAVRRAVPAGQRRQRRWGRQPRTSSRRGLRHRAPRRAAGPAAPVPAAVAAARGRTGGPWACCLLG